MPRFLKPAAVFGSSFDLRGSLLSVFPSRILLLVALCNLLRSGLYRDSRRCLLMESGACAKPSSGIFPVSMRPGQPRLEAHFRLVGRGKSGCERSNVLHRWKKETRFLHRRERTGRKAWPSDRPIGGEARRGRAQDRRAPECRLRVWGKPNLSLRCDRCYDKAGKLIRLEVNAVHLQHRENWVAVERCVKAPAARLRKVLIAFLPWSS